MKNATKIAGLVFLAFCLLDIIFVATGHEELRYYSKPLLMPSLALAALLQLFPENKGVLSCLLLAGMLFHAAGDTLLLFDSKGFVFFAAGLGAFMIGHWFYLLVLLHGIGGAGGWKGALCIAVPIVLAPVIVGFFGLDWPLSGVVTVYALTLLYLVSSGVLWSMRGRRFAVRVILGGAIFIVSDTLLALNAFAGTDFPTRHSLVMITYLTAEWLLVSAMVRTIQAEVQRER